MSALPVSLTPLQIRACQRGSQLHLLRPGLGIYRRLEPGALLWIREPFRLEPRYDGISAVQADRQNARPAFAADRDDRTLGKLRGCRLLPRAWHRYHARVLAVRDLRGADLTVADVADEDFTSVRAWADQWDRARISFGNTDFWSTNPRLRQITLQPILSPVPEQQS